MDINASLYAHVKFFSYFFPRHYSIFISNDEEKENDPILKEKSDIQIKWPTYGEENLNKCKPKIKKALKDLKLIQ